MKSQGIDWSLGTANVNKETGIHYGVIPQNDILQAWSDSSEAVYPDTIEIENESFDTASVMAADSDIANEIDPIEFTYESDGYAMTQGADDTDIFVLRSPYYTYAPYCSPCAPGACYLPDAITMQTNDLDNFARVYCVGKTWFEDEKCPYIYWSVKTGKVEYKPENVNESGQALLEFVFVLAFIAIILWFALPWCGVHLF